MLCCIILLQCKKSTPTDLVKASSPEDFNNELPRLESTSSMYMCDSSIFPTTSQTTAKLFNACDACDQPSKEQLTNNLGNYDITVGNYDINFHFNCTIYNILYELFR